MKEIVHKSSEPCHCMLLSLLRQICSKIRKFAFRCSLSDLISWKMSVNEGRSIRRHPLALYELDLSGKLVLLRLFTADGLWPLSPESQLL